MDRNRNLVGQTIMEDLYIEEFIGAGGFGDVYKAYSDIGSQRVYFAVKHMTVPRCIEDYEECLRSVGQDRNAADNYFRELFEEILGEILMMVQLSRLSKNIVAYNHHSIVTRTGEFKGYEIFIKMELLTPLEKYCSDRCISAEEFIRLGMEIASALEVCHSKNVLHRDIKEANIFIDEEGTYKLGDFGLAKNLRENAGARSNVGTSAYKAPEIFNPANPYDKRVDIYALGIVLYKIFNNGRLPFLPQYPETYGPKAIDDAVLRRARGEKLPPPANAPEALGDVILKACAPLPEARYQTAEELRKALEAAKGRLSPGELTLVVSAPSNNGPHDMESSAGKYFSSFGRVVGREEDYIHEDFFKSGKGQVYNNEVNAKPISEIDIQLWETARNEGTEEALKGYLACEIEGKQFEKEAIELLEKLQLAKRVKQSRPYDLNPGELPYADNDNSVSGIQEGDYLEFGEYGGKPVLWRCIKTEKDGVIMVSEYILCSKAYDAAESSSAEAGGTRIQKWGCADWKCSNLREWLNSASPTVKYSTAPPTEKSLLHGLNPYFNEPGFLYNFTGEEQSILMPVKHGKTEDLVFLLSSSEIKLLGGNREDRIRRTRDADNSIRPERTGDGRDAWYWLRSDSESSECEIVYEGDICLCDAFDGGGGVVPAIKLRQDIAFHPGK